MPWPWGRTERRDHPFQEWLSRFMVKVAAIGAFYVLIDPKVTATDNAFAFVMNSGGFSQDLKGMVIGAILVGGFSSVREFWLGTSKGGQEAAASLARTAEASSPVAVAALVASASPAAWQSGKDYANGDIVLSPLGSAHVCLVPHTSSDWDKDLAANKWAPKTP
jgi:hypothetical protein